MAARWLSILSKTPPWLGMRFDESLTPATLLKRLATASPRTENKPVIKNKVNKYKKGRLVIKLKRTVKLIGTNPIAIKKPS